MSYSRSTWVKGDVISSARLNNIEQGIVNITNHVDSLNNTDTASGYNNADGGATSTNFISKITQASGQVTIYHTPFSPDLTLTDGDATNPPKLLYTVSGNPSNEVTMTRASTDNVDSQTGSYTNGDLGVTQLCTETLRYNNLNDMTKAVTPKGLWNAINSLDVTNDSNDPYHITGFSSDKTLSALTETNGRIAATFQEIYINSAHITDSADGSGDGSGNSAEGNKVVKTNNSGIIPPQLLPSYVDDILEFATINDFPYTTEDETPADGHIPTGPEKGKIYVDLSTGRQYRWSGSQYTETGVIHLDNADTPDSGDVNNPINNWNKYYVKGVTQDDGLISVEHAEFSPIVTWNPASASAQDTNGNKPTITISVGGNPSASTTPNIATTSVYGITKLYDNTDSTSTEMAATANIVHSIYNTITSLNESDQDAANSKFVSSVTQNAGQISVAHASFSPALTLIEGNASSAPKLNISVAGNTMVNPIELTKATTGAYGVTFLSNDINSNDTDRAATPKAVRGAVESLVVDNLSSSDAGYDALKAHITGFGAGKTLASLTETNGKIAATFQDIVITPSQIDGMTVEDILDLEDENEHKLNEWQDITNDCEILSTINPADVQVLINDAYQIGYFMCKSPSGTPANAPLIKLTPLGNMRLGQYFNSRMDGSMLVSAEIPDKSKTITQIHSSNGSSTKTFGASGMFMFRKPVYHTLTINYAGNGINVPAYTDDVEEYDTYSITSPTVQYFTPDRASVTGQMDVSNVTENVTYTRNNHTLTVNYVSNLGETLHAPASLTKPAGLQYEISAEPIEHFTADHNTISNLMPDQNASETFTYTRITHTLTINYIDEEDNILDTYSAEIGEALTYNVPVPTIANYTTEETVTTGTMGTQDITLTVVYTPTN